MALLSFEQTLYLSIGAISLAIAILLILYLLYRNIFSHKKIRDYTYLNLKRICQKNDYLLLNDYRLNFDDNNTGLVDHLLISNKFIFIISIFPISGVLSGDYQGSYLVNVNKSGINKIANPINYNINLAKRISLFNDLNLSFLKGLVVIDNDSDIHLTGHDEQFRIIKRKDLKKTIYSFDRVNIKNLNEDSVVRFINKLSESNKNENQ